MTPNDDARIIFEDAAIRVIYQPGMSDHLVIAFGNLEELADGTRFFADKPLKTLGFAAIGIMAKQGNWFPSAPMHAALPAIASLTKGYRTIVGFGSSMGGYGAVKYSRLIGATHVISCEPQWSIDAAECGTSPGWQGHFKPEMAGMGVRAEDIGGQIFVLRDPWLAHDEWHARRIAALDPTICLVPVYGAGHNTVKVLAGSANLDGIIAACMAGDPALMTRRCRFAGRDSQIRRYRLLRLALGRHPKLAIPQILRLLPHQLVKHFGPHLATLIAWQLHQQGPAAARALYNSVKFRLGTDAERTALTARISALTGLRQVLSFGKGRVLIYDATSDRIGHRQPPLSLGEIALTPELRNSKLRLFCEAEDLRLPVRIDRQGRLGLGEDGDRPARFEIKALGCGQYALCSGPHYLHTDDAGGVHLAPAPPQGQPGFTMAQMLLDGLS